MRSFEVVSQVVAARGSENIYYDGRLDLTVNAGPLERIQGLLRKVGGILGRITDQLVHDRVRGAIDKPSVSVQPLRIGSQPGHVTASCPLNLEYMQGRGGRITLH